MQCSFNLYLLDKKDDIIEISKINMKVRNNMKAYDIKILVDFVVLIVMYFCIFYKKWKSKGKDVLFINTLMYIYLSFVLYFTLMPIIAYIPYTINNLIFNHNYNGINLIPFIDVSYGRGDFIRQIVLNIIMTIPFGFLLPLMKKENIKLLKTILYTFIFSLSIEILQIIFVSSGRSADITDIITNVIGGIIGYILYLIFRPLTIKILNILKKI